MGKQKVQVGDRFGKLVVIEKAEPYISPKGVKVTRYKCQCDCGNINVVPSSALGYSKTQSCGCLKHQTNWRFENLTGKKFAHLLVLERVEDNKHHQVQYRCLCDCGRECVVVGMNLKSSKAQSCGCRTFHKTNLKDITGQKFGMLTVLGRAYNNRTQTAWNVRCDCGKELVVLGSNLKKGNTTSCGCKKEPNLICRVFGRLTVIRQVKNKISNSGKTDRQFLCKCSCGKETIVPAFRLLNGTTTSCGCYATEQSAIRNTTHGESDTRLYHIWTGMKQRCYNSKSISYKNYGARGIVVCDEWFDDFQAFYDWAMANGYADELSIDRIDSNDIYKPSNCRWATMEEQQNNKRNNHLLTYNGETLTVNQMARKYGLNIGVFKCNILKGIDVETAIKITSKAKKAL